MFLSSLLVIAFLILVSALYVAAELGMVAVRRTRVKQLAEEGHWLAARLMPVVSQPAELDRAIAACQIGITVSSLVLGAYGQATLAPLLADLLSGVGVASTAAAHSAAAAVILVALTVVHMIFGELLPKSFALEFPTQTSLATIVPIGWSLRIFSPLLYLFNGSGLLLLKLLGVKPTRHHHVHSAAEIDLLIAEAPVSDDSLDPEDRRRLRRALQLGTRRARDLMVPRERIVAIDIESPPAEVVAFIGEAPYTRIPVYRGTLDQVIGFLHTKDVLLRQMGGRAEVPVRDLVRPIVSVPAQATADQVLVLLRERRVQLGLVVGERGEPVGLISLEDVLSEVFGALSDELKGSHRRPLGKRRRRGDEGAR
ncbi:MAG TPA: hemolysin family protein [Kofleriaceae bacterium]|nr:hemolysin family protein [Kofleriaceae bacterium]